MTSQASRAFARSAFLLAALLLVALGARAQFIQRNIYNPGANARADIHYALLTAQRDHKRVILDFGGNWCADCIVLNYYFHQPPNAQLLDRNFVLVDIDIGQYDHNLDIARQYGIPLKLGVPALAVLSPGGQLLYSQRNGEFEKMEHMDPSSVTAFLNRWKPAS
jgi:thioredoxin 1